MASYFKKDGIYQVKYKDADGKWKMKSCGAEATAADAQRLTKEYAAKELNARHGIAIRQIAVNLFSALDDFRDNIIPLNRTGKDKAENTVRREKQVIINFVKWLEEEKINDIRILTHETIKKYLVNKLAEKAAKTRKEERRIMYWFFQWAMSKSYCERNPVEGIPIPQIVRDEHPRFFSVEELKVIFEKAKTPYKNIYRFLYLTGIRIGEMRNLCWSDVNEKDKKIVLRIMKGNKTKRVTTVPLSVDALKVIQEQKTWRDKIGTDDAKMYPFTNSVGHRIVEKNVLECLKFILRDNELPPAKTHTLRHTCASHLVINGVSLYTVKDLLRHKSIRETEVYAHLSKDVVRNAVELLPKIAG